MDLLSQPNIHVIKVTGRQEGISEKKEEIAGWRLNLIGSLKPQHMEELAESQAKYTRRKLTTTNPKFPKTTDKEKNVGTTGQKHRAYIEEQRPGWESSRGRSVVEKRLS